MSRERAGVSVGLGEVTPRSSRQQWRRSSVAVLGDTERTDGERERSERERGQTESAGGSRPSSDRESDGGFVVGTADGTVRALEADGRERWRASGDEMAVSLVESAGRVAVGSRGDRGRIRLLDADSGEQRWQYDAADDLGGPAKESLFFYPYVVDAVADGRNRYVAARRYERDGDRRVWRSAVYAFDPDGGVRWTYATDASPIALSLGSGPSPDDHQPGGRLAVAYNRCGGDHDRGLVVLDAATGDPVADWDPGTDGERRVGDASLAGDALAAASHGDYRGYLLGSGGEERWRTDLGVEREVGDETLYTYPNHVHLFADAAVFVTGNTFPVEGREAEGRHPDEHTIAAVSRDGGELLWSAPVGGFTGELAAADGRVAVPAAQHFRDRDADAHGLRVFDARDGLVSEIGTEGIVAAAALSGDRAAFVEEPVEYHDEGETRGEYRLRVVNV